MTTRNVAMDRPRLERLLRGGVSVTLPITALEVSGAGAVECLQGLLTNDLVAPGPNRVTYSALLTPKGMMISDLWVIRLEDTVLLLAPPEARAPLLEVFRRSLPPRLASVADLSEAWETTWLFGERAEAALAEAGLGTGSPDRGRAVRLADQPRVISATGTALAPFAALLAGPQETLAGLSERLRDGGMSPGDGDDVHAARVLGGWPALGLEIGEKTLPQEVRLDDLDGVSFTKGCFLGQETVARIHFRGQTRKVLRGLDWTDLGGLDGAEVLGSDRALGTVHSILSLPDRRLGLAMIRREAEIGESVTAGGREARIVPLPFDPPDRAA